jgi:hypothetical protein
VSKAKERQEVLLDDTGQLELLDRFFLFGGCDRDGRTIRGSNRD